jgi:KaiC/GvpD/RAD55 family RecA-like ATPase
LVADVLTLQLIGDLFISASALIPYVIAFDVKRRLKVRVWWWAFFIGLIGFAGHAAVIIAAWLGYISFGLEFFNVGTFARMLISIGAVIMVLDVLNISPPRFRTFLTLVAAAPALSILLRRLQGGTPIGHEILVVQTIYYGFIFWACFTYYSLFFYPTLVRAVGFHKGLTILASVMYGVAGLQWLYIISGYLYNLISLHDALAWRAVLTTLGTIAGIILLNVAVRVKTAIPTTVKVGRFDVLPTGVKEVDDEVGGLPYPSSILVMGQSGSGKTGFVSRFCATRLGAGDAIAWFCTEYSAEDARDMLITHDLPGVARFEEDGRLILVDCYLQQSGVIPKERFTSSTNLSDLSIMISKTLDLLKGERKWIVLDSLSGLTREHGVEKMLKFLSSTSAKLATAKAGFIATINNRALSEIEISIIQEQFHGNIQLDLTEEGGRLRRRIRIVKTPTGRGSAKWRCF